MSDIKRIGKNAPKMPVGKLMMVSNHKDFRKSYTRVVIGVKVDSSSHPVYFAWVNATTLAEAENEFAICKWKYAKELPQEITRHQAEMILYQATGKEYDIKARKENE